ncbi:MAG: hypothetical protein ACTHXA_02695 [Gulosibacter sp.]|uniref:hypothetical protein n=1 Tax=Gulosibacter sp. TaxID=2817531 RepID=UPI003F924DBB
MNGVRNTVDVTLDLETRSAVARIMDVLLPGTESLPSATDVNAQDEMLDRTLKADPTLAPIVRKAGEMAKDASEITFDDIQTWMGEDLERLNFALHAAYYMVKEVRNRLGYPGQGRHPVSEATPDQLVTPELLAPVIERGPIYVPTPEE